MMHVIAWGIGTCAVDHGRPGRARYGQSRGGAVDPGALALGNRLVGNDVHAAGIEKCGGFTFRVDAPALVCLTGSSALVQVQGGPALGWGAPVALPAGAVVRIVRLLTGARTYLCVRGGIGPLSSEPVDRLVVGPDPGTPATAQAAVPRPLGPTVRVWPGPRLDWFEPGAWQQLTADEWEVTATSRVGTRLSGPTLERVRVGELPSEGLVEGAVQVPPDGRPIVMLADHPTTGGYPVIAVVDPADLVVVAQAPPGATLHLRARSS